MIFAVTTAMIAFLWTLAGGISVAQAQQERILEFSSIVHVRTTGLIQVEETIRVNAQGNKINRGIYRDFPTTYSDGLGKKFRVGFDVVSVTRNGSPENYALENLSNGKRIRIGNADHFLSYGAHEYKITYETTRQIGFFEEWDELYWNVTGTGWDFPIDVASATVYLPDGAGVMGQSVYTGPQDSSAGNATSRRQADGSTLFRTSQPLNRNEGLTIALSWPKGFVDEPTGGQRMGHFFADNAPLFAALGGFLIVLAYYAYTWSRVGRDPQRGNIFPQFGAPEGLSPAACRYVRNMGYDKKSFSAAIINMAVKKYLTIKEEGDTYRLARTDTPYEKLSPGERRIGTKLFHQNVTVLLENDNHKTVNAAIHALDDSLENEYEAAYFKRNRTEFFVGIGISIATILPVIFLSDAPAEIGFISIWLTIWTVGVVTLVTMVMGRWAAVFTGIGNPIGNVMGALLVSLFALPFVLGEIGAMFFLATLVSIPVVLCISGTLILNGVFFHLLKAPTLAGAKVMDAIDGFKMYMGTAEQARLDALNPPEMTPEHFEALLPYAIALDVENQWSEKFASHVESIGDPSEEGGYSPDWYNGRRWSDRGASGFGGALSSSITSSAASAATAPSSSSGSSGSFGGGSSGGGGGGGGGGGW
jgi:uncharacterized membrane protein YgcG